MITPEDREAGLSMSALIELQALGGALPEPVTSNDKTSLTAQVVRLGWKILPIPGFYAAKQMWHDPRSGGGNPAYIDFQHVYAWLIVPPDSSSLRATKVSGGKISAIRAAYRLAIYGEDNTAQPAREA
jgi:hypothetical protein